MGVGTHSTSATGPFSNIINRRKEARSNLLRSLADISPLGDVLGVLLGGLPHSRRRRHLGGLFPDKLFGLKKRETSETDRIVAELPTE